MTELLDRLAEDHRRLKRVMDLLEASLDRFHQGEEPDYELLTEVLQYMSDYADQVHHPSEDLLYERALQQSGQGRDVLRRLMVQHQELAQLNRRFRASLEGIVNEEVIPRDEVEQQGRELLQALTDHMALEDDQAFPILKTLFDDAVWEELARQAPKAGDPVFGEDNPEQFRALYNRLRADLH